VRVSHEHTAVFDDPNLVSCAGLAPVLTLADRAGLHEHLARHLMLAGCAGMPSCGMWRKGALPEPPGGLSFDGLAVWSAVF